MLELLAVVLILTIVAAIATPNILQAVYNARLRSAAGDLSGLMQQARIRAAKDNATYDIRYATQNGMPIAFIDLNLNGQYDSGEPLVYFNKSVTAASGAPGGSGGQPSAYTLVGDSGSGSYDNTNTLAFSPRGLPCNYDTPPTCTTPAAKYFVYYLFDTRPLGVSGWAAVAVTKSGRSTVKTWNGAAWN